MALTRSKTSDGPGETRTADAGERRGPAPGIVRGLFTLAGVAIAGFLVWLASQFDLGTTSGFWSAMGLIAAAGATLGFSQLFGGWTKWGWPRISPLVFLIGFLPTLLIAGGILLAVRPSAAGTQDTVREWARDLGLSGFVGDMALFSSVLAFTVGLVFSFIFDTTGPRQRTIPRDRAIPDEDVHDYRRGGDADREQTILDRGDRDRAIAGRDTGDRTVAEEIHDRPTVTTGGGDDRVEIRDPARRDRT